MFCRTIKLPLGELTCRKRIAPLQPREILAGSEGAANKEQIRTSRYLLTFQGPPPSSDVLIGANTVSIPGESSLGLVPRRQGQRGLLWMNPWTLYSGHNLMETCLVHDTRLNSRGTLWLNLLYQQVAVSYGRFGLCSLIILFICHSLIRSRMCNHANPEEIVTNRSQKIKVSPRKLVQDHELPAIKPSLYPPTQVKDVLLHCLGQFSTTCVHMSHGLGPGFWVWDWQIYRVSRLDMAREHECC